MASDEMILNLRLLQEGSELLDDVLIVNNRAHVSKPGQVCLSLSLELLGIALLHVN